MLALLLAAALDPQVGLILSVCDTPKMTAPCGTYLRGFVDALQATNELTRDLTPELACFGTVVDYDALRLAVVKDLRNPPRPTVTARGQVLMAVAKAYPCKER